MPRLVERGGGAFVGVSARAALRPFAGAAGYIAGKAALLAFVQALDAEYKGQGVRANAILPSVIDTPANRASQPDADYSKWVDPKAIAKVVRFLVSDESATLSGAAVPVYGCGRGPGRRSTRARASRAASSAAAFCIAPIGAPIRGMSRPA